MDIYCNPERRGSSGRVPDSKRQEHKLFQRVNITLDPDTYERLERFCADHERARSWAIQKAVSYWLKQQGY